MGNQEFTLNQLLENAHPAGEKKKKGAKGLGSK
jgi:hypothetical protein